MGPKLSPVSQVSLEEKQMEITDGEKVPWRQKQTEAMWLQAMDCWQPSEPGMDSALEPAERGWFCCPLISAQEPLFQTSGLQN